MQVFGANGFRSTDSHILPLFIISVTHSTNEKPPPSLTPNHHTHQPHPLYIQAFSSSSSPIITPPFYVFLRQISSLRSPQLADPFMDSSSASIKRPCFLEENCGLAFLADMEAGYSGQNHHHYQQGFVSKSMGYAIINRSSFRSLPGSSPRSGRFYDARYEDHQPYFLEACHLCKKPLQNRDIFMYRGDTPFCSEECRQEQIDMDEAIEKDRNLSSSMKAMRKKQQRESTSPNKSQDYSCVRGTIAAAS